MCTMNGNFIVAQLLTQLLFYQTYSIPYNGNENQFYWHNTIIPTYGNKKTTSDRDRNLLSRKTRNTGSVYKKYRKDKNKTKVRYNLLYKPLSFYRKGPICVLSKLIVIVY